MKEKNNLDVNEFLTEVGVVQLGIFSNQKEFDAISQLFLPHLLIYEG